MAIKKPIHKLVFFLLVGVLIWFLHKPVWNGFRNWRAGQLLSQSREFAAERNWQEARRTAIASYQITKSIEPLRLLFEGFLAQRDAQTLHCGVSVFRHPEATIADRARVLEVFIDSGDLVTAGGFLGGLGDATESEPALYFQRMRFHLASRQFKEALELAAKQPDGGGDPQVALLLVKHLTEARNVEFQDEITRRIESLLGSEDQDVAVQAMKQLAALPRPWITDRLLVMSIRRFRDATDLGPDGGLALAFLRISQVPADLDLVVAEMITKYREDGLGPLVEWLARLGEWERVVEVTEGLQLKAGTFEYRLSALQRLGRYETMQEELKNPSLPAPTPLLLATRAAVETKLNNNAGAVTLWTQAFEAADVDRSENFFYRLAIIARETGAREREMEALARAIEHPRGSPPTSDRLVPLFAWLHLTGQPERLLSVSYRLLQREPANAVLMNNFHYLRALNDEQSEKAVEVMRAIVEAFPEIPGYRSTLALALVRDGNPAEALVTLEALDLPPAELDPGEKAIYAIALARSDRPDEAKALAAEVDWDRFPREEAKVLQGLISP